MMQSFRVLAVDDEEAARFSLAEAFQQDGYTLIAAGNGEEALEQLRETFFDLVFLDIELEGRIDGLRVLEAVRWRWPEALVIAMAAPASLKPIQAAVREGINGLVLRPLQVEQVRQAATEAFARRKELAAKSWSRDSTLVCGELIIDLQKRLVQRQGEVVALTDSEFLLLACLAQNSHRAVGVRELVQVLRGYECENEWEARILCYTSPYSNNPKIRMYRPGGFPRGRQVDARDATAAQLKQAIVAIQSGRLEEARRMLAAVLQQDPDNAEAWVWLGKAVDGPEKRKECFSRALRLDPDNQEARQGMVALLSGPQVEEKAESTGEPTRVSAYPSPCPNCGAHLRYEVAAGALRCDHCGTTQAVPGANSLAVWLGMPPDLSTPEAQGEVIGREILRCRSCGATSELSSRTSSMACPFCGSPQVVRGQGTHYLIPPKAIVPFLFDRDDALRVLREWLGQGWLHPDDLAEQAEITDLQGSYLPFWGFKGLVEVNFRLENTSGLETLPMIPSVQNQHITVPDMLIPASYSLEKDIWKEIQPFELDRAVPFRPEFLSGWPAEIYQVALADATIQARDHMAKEARGKAQAMVDVYVDTSDADRFANNMRLGYHSNNRRQVTYRPEVCGVKLDSFQHFVLPVWLGAYRYRGKSYSFAVNGQTGKAGGEAPHSKSMMAMTGIIAVLSLVFIGILLAILWPTLRRLWDSFNDPSSGPSGPAMNFWVAAGVAALAVFGVFAAFLQYARWKGKK